MEAAWSGWPPEAVRRWPNEQSSDIPRMLKGCRFGEAPERLIEAARRIVGWKGVFASSQSIIT